jgi:hypothetical protein
MFDTGQMPLKLGISPMNRFCREKFKTPFRHKENSRLWLSPNDNALRFPLDADSKYIHNISKIFHAGGPKSVKNN